jgi:hypothetical protein
MPESVQYEIIRGSVESVEKEANELAAFGWRVVTSVSFPNWEVGLVIKLPVPA